MLYLPILNDFFIDHNISTHNYFSIAWVVQLVAVRMCIIANENMLDTSIIQLGYILLRKMSICNASEDS